jgi:hypothetical protein
VALLLKHWPIILALIGFAFIGAGIYDLRHKASMVPGLQTQVSQYKQAYTDESKAFQACESLRSIEQQQAIKSADDAEKSCQSRIAEARRSSVRIREITNEAPTLDQNGMPVRELYDPGELRDALGAAR